MNYLILLVWPLGHGTGEAESHIRQLYLWKGRIKKGVTCMFGKQKRTMLSMMLIVLCTQAAVVFAAQGGVNFVAVYLKGGGEVQAGAEIHTDSQFIVRFDKNVISEETWEENSQCFSLVSADEENVPVVINTLAGIYQPLVLCVQPEKSLQPDTVYYLIISTKLRDNNGATLGEEKSLAFRTMKGQAKTIPQLGDAKKPQDVAND